MLRYRLYDIDVVITAHPDLRRADARRWRRLSRLVLLILALSGSASPISPIAGSTLAVAALFRPARARIQATVDRRFYRRRYDAAQTLERSAGDCATSSTSRRSRTTCARSCATRRTRTRLPLAAAGS